VRRVRHRTEQGQLFSTWDYHAFVTDRPGSPVELDAEHRRHAVIKLAIRDAKQASGLNHQPSGRFATGLELPLPEECQRRCAWAIRRSRRSPSWARR
jgi:hypothetical protein